MLKSKWISIDNDHHEPTMENLKRCSDDTDTQSDTNG